MYDRAVVAHLLWEGTHLVWLVSDEPANGLLARASKVPFTTKGRQVDEHLLLPKVRMLCPDSTDFLRDGGRPLPGSDMVRTTRLLVETLSFAATSLKLRSPGIQRAPGNLECLQGCPFSMAFPKGDDLQFLLGFVADHTSPP